MTDEPVDGAEAADPGERPVPPRRGDDLGLPEDAHRGGRRRSLDPQGRRALFETPVSAAADTVRSGAPRDGRAALFSSGPRQRGTVVVTCSACEARSRINLTDLGLRFLSGSAWLPGKREGHWMRCPSCERRTWCAVGWQD